MRTQLFIIAVLFSLIAWGGAFQGARDIYRVAQEAKVIPNLHLKHRLSQLL